MAIKRTRRSKQQKLTKPNVFSFIAYTLILFFGATILVNVDSNANQNYREEREARKVQPMEWIFFADNGEVYNVFNPVALNGEHAAPEDWDYLFPEEEYKNETWSLTSDFSWALYTGSIATWGRDYLTWEVVISGATQTQEIENTWKGDLYTWAIPYLIGDKEALSWSWEISDNTGTLQEKIEPTTDLISQNSSWFKTPKKAYGALWSSLEDRSVFMNMVFEYLLRGDIVELPEWAVRYVVLLYGMENEIKEQVFAEKSCMTPWGYEINHGASVLAYEQRSDAPNVCNIQRRTCKNGKLSWSFTQSSCDENRNGNLKKIPYTVSNTEQLGDPIPVIQKIDEYIQPSEDAKNKNAEFDFEGKINTHTNPHIIALPKDGEISPDPVQVPKEQHPRQFCQTPRGEKVKQWQFTKAYRFQNGFTDIPCKVQLRLCVDGELEGTYQYATCQPRETAYEDFLYGYMNNEEPSPQRLIKMLQTEVTPDPEYGNNLSPEIIDTLLNILHEE